MQTLIIIASNTNPLLDLQNIKCDHNEYIDHMLYILILLYIQVPDTKFDMYGFVSFMLCLCFVLVQLYTDCDL